MASTTRYCRFRHKNALETLKLIPIKILHKVLPLVVTREERDTGNGELITNGSEHTLFGAAERDGFSPYRPVH